MPRFLLSRDFWIGVAVGWFLFSAGGLGVIQDLVGRAGLHIGSSGGGSGYQDGVLRGGRGGF